MRAARPETKIILTEPANAALLASDIAQERRVNGAPQSGHPAWEPHPIQGWTPDFIPLVLQETIDKKSYDQLLPVNGDDGVAWAQKLAKQEGILTGISGGSTFAITMQIAQSAKAGSVLLCMLPDTGERYMSTPLFESIEAEMNAEEEAISRSTPTAQME